MGRGLPEGDSRQLAVGVAPVSGAESGRDQGRFGVDCRRCLGSSWESNWVVQAAVRAGGRGDVGQTWPVTKPHTTYNKSDANMTKKKP